MSNSKSMRISVTNGNEEIVKENYKIIRALANHAAESFKIKIDDVINYMTASTSLLTNETRGLTAGSFNNYCRKGRVSEYACDKLKGFFENELPISVLTGIQKISVEHVFTIFGVLMEKLNTSNIVKVRMGKIVNNATIYYRKDDFIEILKRDLKNNTIWYNENQSEDQYVDVQDIEDLDIEIEKLLIENDEVYEYNSLYVGLGLDPIIHDNNEFIKYISIETLWEFDLTDLKNCYESYKRVIDVFESIIKIKETKLELK